MCVPLCISQHVHRTFHSFSPSIITFFYIISFCFIFKKNFQTVGIISFNFIHVMVFIISFLRFQFHSFIIFYFYFFDSDTNYIKNKFPSIFLTVKMNSIDLLVSDVISLKDKEVELDCHFDLYQSTAGNAKISAFLIKLTGKL